MDTIIVVVLLLVSLFFNMKMYKQLNSNKQPAKKSAYAKSWDNGGKAKDKWSTKKPMK